MPHLVLQVTDPAAATRRRSHRDGHGQASGDGHRELAATPAAAQGVGVGSYVSEKATACGCWLTAGDLAIADNRAISDEGAEAIVTAVKHCSLLEVLGMFSE